MVMPRLDAATWQPATRGRRTVADVPTSWLLPISPDRTFGAVMLPWEGGLADGSDVEPGSRIDRLRDDGVDVAVIAAAPSAAVIRRLRPRVVEGGGRLLVCGQAGVHLAEVRTDGDGAPRPLAAGSADLLGWLLEDLADRGIGPGLVVAVSGSDPRLAWWDARLRGAPARLVVIRAGSQCPAAVVRLVDEQLGRHAQRRVPWIDEDPAWTVTLHGDDRALMRVHEALLTVADGRFGTRGSREEGGDGSDPLVTASGVYTPDPGGIPHLLPGPLWTGLEVTGSDLSGERRVLDLRSGVLVREVPGRIPLRTVRFASLARPGSMLLRAEGPVDGLAAGPTLAAPDGLTAAGGERDGVRWMRTTGGRGGITAAGTSTVAAAAGRRTVDRLVAYSASQQRAPATPTVCAMARHLEEAGFDRLLRQQREAWGRRWRDAAVSIDGDPEAEQAVRFALFHLMAAVAGRGEAAVGARGLSGRAYAGHVFWDTDVFVLPFLAATHPPAARAILEYRLRRLPAARERARRGGWDGARFPWESAADGREVTPTATRAADGSLLRILTGEHEEHISADIAWAADHYAAWSGDNRFLAGPGRPLVVETARYWASRIRLGADGRGHLYGVIGPDEYHGPVDDNAYTNVMVRWHLRRAATLAEQADDDEIDAGEVARWRRLAGSLVDGYDPATGRYEQFAGFGALEPLVVSQFAQPPVAADVLLGRARVAASQIIKQADVLMLHHLVPGETAAGSLRPNLDYYLPRTAHGSSLSPAIHAALLARAGEPDRALDLFRMACRIDLDDRTGTAAGGLHLAAMGGVWQAVAHGFAGLRPAVGALRVNPHLPAAWQAVEVRVRFAGTPVRVRAGHDHLDVVTAGPVPVRAGGGAAVTVRGHARFTRSSGGWEEVRP